MGILMTIGIYSLYWEQQDLVYIGQSTEIETRKYTHLHNMRAGAHSNYKIQNAYNKYGDPEFIILSECTASALDASELYWQKEFNSLDSLDIVLAGSSRFGVNNGNSKYTRIQILLAFRYASLVGYTSIEVAKKLGVSVCLIDDLRAGRAHTYLKDEFPYKYKIMLSNSSNRNLLGYHKSGNSASYAAITKKVPILISPTGEEHLVPNFREFGRQHKLDSTDISRVVSGKYKHTRGWVLKT